MIESSLAEIDASDSGEAINGLQSINDHFSKLFGQYGAPSLDDIGKVCVGSGWSELFGPDSPVADFYTLLESHVHPIRYHVLDWPESLEQTIKPNFIAKRLLVDDETIMRTAPMLECFDLSRTDEEFFIRVHGIRVTIHVPGKRQTILVDAVVDDIPLNTIVTNNNIAGNDRFIGDMRDIRYIRDKDGGSDDTVKYSTKSLDTSFGTFMESITIKQLIVFTPEDMYQKFKYMMFQSNGFNSESLTKVANDFMSAELYSQRARLMAMIVGAETQEHRYIVNLLYELLGMGYNGIGPSPEQSDLLSSFPWSIRCYFSVIANQSSEYTKNLSTEFDPKQIPYEKRICLMKTSDEVKNKAMVKLKEVRSKNEDTGSKARAYLDGLLDIPFGEFRHEEILDVTKQCTSLFGEMISGLTAAGIDHPIPVRTTFTSVDCHTYMPVVRRLIDGLMGPRITAMKGLVTKKSSKPMLLKLMDRLSTAYKAYGDDIGLEIQIDKSMNRQSLVTLFESIVDGCSERIGLLDHIVSTLCPDHVDDISSEIISNIDSLFYRITAGYDEIAVYSKQVRQRLDDSVVGHDKPKRQIERVIAQWMNGDNGGYVFGFEGPPGVGKTSLAKYGISKCLTDANGNSRPFAFIGVGGSANGSTFEGHNYTYVGATWGRIVSILMETKVSNPIIFIDEVDKISRTEHGRELIGILTHLVDPTQNSAFHDKYFSGVDIDLSKVLFVFSYNDVSAIDRILLDRIHRVRFGSLDEAEKVQIVQTQMLPELLKRFNLEGSIEIPESVVRHIIQEYTCEAGVRKLKEILYEIVSEINLSILRGGERHESAGKFVVTEELLKTDILKERHTVREKMIHPEPIVGVINGMWANAMGQGGVLPIESREFPSSAPLELKLTGMQGDVMKESMSVAKTLAWSLLTSTQQSACMKRMNGKIIKSGIHIHCPEGAVPKDGPSAGTAITVVMYSLLTQRKIKNALSITGEMCLQGRVTAIGGLDLKILGAARAGVKDVIFPKENEKDFDDFMEKYSGMAGVSDITFHMVETIDEVLKLVFV
jgi:ATP-dependent Lon protease